MQKWQHDMFQGPQRGGGAGGRGGGRGGGVKLMISNLDYGVSTDDVKVRISFCECCENLV